MAAGPGWQAPPASLVICVAACWPALPRTWAGRPGEQPGVVSLLPASKRVP